MTNLRVLRVIWVHCDFIPFVVLTGVETFQRIARILLGAQSFLDGNWDIRFLRLLCNEFFMEKDKKTFINVRLVYFKRVVAL